MRSVLFNWSRSVPPTEWQEIIKVNLTTNRYERLPSYEPRILFSRKSSPLYLSDLMVLLKDRRVLPFLQNRPLIVQYMNLINKFRIDAHANEIADEDMTDVRTALEFLEAEFIQP